MCSRAFRFVVVALLLSASSAVCVTINSATVSGNQLTIAGLGFTSTTSVTLAGQKLTLISITSTQIIANMSVLPASGSYRLVVKTGTASTFAYVQVPGTPGIVAQVALTNQSGIIPQTTLVTAAQNSLYRLSIYETGCPGGSPASVSLQWTDDAGTEASGVQLSSFNHAGIASGTANFELTAGAQLSYSVYPNCAPYDLYMTLEQLQ